MDSLLEDLMGPKLKERFTNGSRLYTEPRHVNEKTTQS